jgi:hypothetical protein
MKNFIPIIGLVLLTGCSTMSKAPPLSYFQSQHDPNNRLIFFFMEDYTSNNAYDAYFVTDGDDIKKLLALGNPGFLDTKLWHNTLGAPHISAQGVAVFDLPEEIGEVAILFNWKVNGFGVMLSSKRFHREFIADLDQEQYYVLNFKDTIIWQQYVFRGIGDIDPFDAFTVRRIFIDEEIDRYLSAATRYANKRKKSPDQPGFIVLAGSK